MLSKMFEDMIPRAERYIPKRPLYGTACFNCFKVAPELQKCSRCKRVKYCNDACQKANFSEHKRFCKLLANFRASTRGSPRIYGNSPEELEQRATAECSETTNALLLASRDGHLTEADRTLIAFEPRCAVCLRSEHNMRTDVSREGDMTGTGPSYGSLIPCRTCLSSFACSSAHWDVYEDGHSTATADKGTPGLSECALNLRAAEDDEFTVLTGTHRPPFVPERRRDTYEALPSADDGPGGASAWQKWWADPENTREVPAPGFPEVAKRACSQALSIPLTILYGIGLFDELSRGNGAPPLHERRELEVAVLGAASYELVAGSMSFEELLHCLPSVRKLTIRLVGPELGEIAGNEINGSPMSMDTCPKCSRLKITRVHIHQTDTFHDYMDSVGPATRRMPDIVVAFNAGMHEKESSKASWAPTVKILAEKSVPTIVTSFQSKEAEADGAFMRAMGCNVVISPHVNPWRSELVIKEPCGASGFYFVNGYIQGFKGKV